MNDQIDNRLISVRTKNRLDYIDEARAIAIFCVIIGHIIIYLRDNFGISHSQLLVFIYSFHMPVFFIISGILFTKKSFNMPFGKYLIKKIYTIVIPYLFLDISGGIFKVAINGEVFNLTNIKVILLRTFTLQPNVGENWFLSALFIGEILVYFFLKYYRPAFKYFILIPFFLIYLYRPFSNYLINTCTRGVIAFTFISTGYFLKDYFLSDINKRLDVIILSFITTYVMAMANGQIDFWSSGIGKHPILCFAGGLSGSYFLIGLSKRLSSKLLIFIGRNTITIMGTHKLFFALLWSFLSITIFRIFPTWTSNIYGFIIFFLIIIIVEFPIMYLYNRFIPFLIGKKRKTRIN